MENNIGNYAQHAKYWGWSGHDNTPEHEHWFKYAAKYGNVESFDHAFYLQGYYREEWLAAFRECGFDVAGEYGDRELASWQSGGGGFRVFEVVKSTAAQND